MERSIDGPVTFSQAWAGRGKAATSPAAAIATTALRGRGVARPKTHAQRPAPGRTDRRRRPGCQCHRWGAPRARWND
eukprot:6788358-Alexandrium_andersonii.AAC.1